MIRTENATRAPKELCCTDCRFIENQTKYSNLKSILMEQSSNNGKQEFAKQVLDEIKASPCNRVKIAVSDMDGVLRGKYIHKDKFLSIVDGGLGFCNVVFGWDCGDVPYDNTTFTGWHTGYPDNLVRLDLNTCRRVPWDDHVPFFLGDFESGNGEPLAVCPRQVLKRVLRRAEKMGLKVLCGMEFEWFNFLETSQSLAAKHFVAPTPLTPGMFGYSLLRANQHQPYFKALMEELAAFRIPIEGLHTETGPGVFEAAILYSEALEAADRAVLFKAATKDIAHRFGIMPSFMAKWSQAYPGCSGHVHQSLSDGTDNLFYDSQDHYRMSKLFKSYLAGQIALMRDVQALYHPTVNSYKRLVDGYWAPVKPTWSIDNRTASFRVIPGSSKSTRLETRCPGADVNPYLAIAASVASGLYGIEKGLALAAPPITGTNDNTEHIPRLPRTLQEATVNLQQSKVARDYFGDAFVDHYCQTRDWEWRQWQDAVTDWELKRYFEII